MAPGTTRTCAKTSPRARNGIATGNLRLLELDGQPVSMSNLNARLPNMGQIGGVFTPPALRCRGYVRTAVALQLAEARGEGMNTAILFANNQRAAKACEATGFRQIGFYSLAIHVAPVTVEEQ